MNKNSKIWTIIRHEYLTKVKTKGFIIGTILGPLGIILILAAVAFVAVISDDTGIKKIALLDKTEYNLGEKIIASDTSRFYETKLTEHQLSEEVRKDKIDGYLVLPKNLLDNNKVKLITRGGGGIAFIDRIEGKVNYYARMEKLKRTNIQPEVISQIESRVRVETEKVTEKGKEKDYTEGFAVLGYILGFIIYMFMFIYGSFVSRGVIEEKANRIVEVIASSVKPFEIMMGKILGIGMVGLTQVLFWIVLLVGLLFIGEPLLNDAFADPEIMAQGQAMMNQQQIDIQQNFGMFKEFLNPWIIVSFLFFFLSGYFIYSTLFAAIGSAVDQEQDAQQLMTPVTMLLIIPMLFIGVIMANPDSTASIILSLVPFFAPILMIVRIAATEVPFWQIATCVVLIISTFFGAVWVASRIYRVGILMYGKKPSLKDLIKWIRIS